MKISRYAVLTLSVLALSLAGCEKSKRPEGGKAGKAGKAKVSKAAKPGAVPKAATPAKAGKGCGGDCPHKKAGKCGDCPHKKAGKCPGDCPHKKAGKCGGDCPHKKAGKCGGKCADCPFKKAGKCGNKKAGKCGGKCADCPNKKDGKCGCAKKKAGCSEHEPKAAAVGTCDRNKAATEALAKGKKVLAGVTLKKSITAKDLLAGADLYEGKKVRVEGPIVAICPGRGCWASLRGPSGKTIKLKVVDGVVDFRKLAKVGAYTVGEGTFHKVGPHGAQVKITGAMVGAVCK